MPKIRAMLVEDHPLFRQGLRRIIDASDTIEIVAELSDGGEVIARVRELEPDVVIMDINLPAKNGLLLTRELSGEFPEIHTVILTAYHDEEQLFHAIRSGAAAYFAKDVDPERLMAGIIEVHRGNFVINGEVMNESRMASWLLKQVEEKAAAGVLSNEDVFIPLSPREMEILLFITKGYSNKEVAHHLGISRQTVKNHMTSILRKLDVNDRTQAAVYALRHGWIRLQDTKYDR